MQEHGKIRWFSLRKENNSDLIEGDDIDVLEDDDDNADQIEEYYQQKEQHAMSLASMVRRRSCQHKDFSWMYRQGRPLDVRWQQGNHASTR